MDKPNQTPDDSIHHCTGEGIPNPFADHDWDLVNHKTDLVPTLAFIAAVRIAQPLAFVQSWMAERVAELAKRYLTLEQREEIHPYCLWEQDLLSQYTEPISYVAAKVADHMPRRFTTLEHMLETAMTESGFCCEGKVDEVIASIVPASLACQIAEQAPGFSPSWLTTKGAREYRKNG
ncbi:MAG: hypothetical protein ACE5Q6_17530 [Dehalococcoidia bacterium]